MAFRDQSGKMLSVEIKACHELICIVEDLKTLRSSAAVRVAITCDDWKTTCYDKILLIEIPE